MFELAARLVGVYKVNHMTKSVTIENQDYIVRLPARPMPAQVAGLVPGFMNTPARPGLPQIGQLAFAAVKPNRMIA